MNDKSFKIIVCILTVIISYLVFPIIGSNVVLLGTSVLIGILTALLF